MRNYLTEFIGTFFLVLTVGLTVTQGSQFAPLAIGASLISAIEPAKASCLSDSGW